MKARSIMQDYQTRINNFLENYLPSEHAKPEGLHQAMRYAVLNGGKRIRPIIIYTIGEAVNAQLEVLDYIAAAVELIHAFSLVHDDLPPLDNDAIRRGKPSCHKAFGEATAILVGDALQTMAFEMLARLRKQSGVNSKICLEMIAVLCRAIGSKGMAGGEFLDISLQKVFVTQEKLERIYKLKTSKLLLASILLALLAGDCHKKNVLINMARFGVNIGIAFQIHDDIIGLVSNTSTLGKPQFSDLKNNKPIYPVITNLDYSQTQKNYFYQKALTYLYHSKLPVDNIKKIADYIITRSY